MSDNSHPFDASSGKSSNEAGEAPFRDSMAPGSSTPGSVAPSYLQTPSAYTSSETDEDADVSSAGPGQTPSAGRASASGSGYPTPGPQTDGDARVPGWAGSGRQPAGFAPYPGGPYVQGPYAQGNGPYPQQQPWQGSGYAPNYAPRLFPQQPGWIPPSAYARWNALCIAGFIVSFIIAPVGLVLSIIALVQIHRTGERSKGMAIAGIAVSIVHMVLVVLLILGFVWMLGQYSSSDSYSCAGSDCTPSWMDTDYGQTDEYAALRQSPTEKSADGLQRMTSDVLP